MSIDIRITGFSNMAAVTRDLDRVTTSTKMLTASMAEANKQAFIGTADKPGGIHAQIDSYKHLNSQVSTLRDNMMYAAKAGNDFNTSSIKVGRETDSMVERIQKSQLGFKDLRREMGLLEKTYMRQMALQKSVATTWGTTAAGSTMVDMMTPNAIQKQTSAIDRMSSRLGFYREVLGSVSTQTVNWGKNTQWAGRQLMAGFTYPMAIAAGASVKFAYDINKGLTQIVKVYGDAGKAMQETDEQIKNSAMDTARFLTQYGQSATDTLEIQSQLASTGKTGKELQAATRAVSEARLLGELEIQDAMKATINLQEVYGMSADRLGDAFNYMNQMENETSLTMQDFVMGIPKVSGIMNTLGADFEDTGILLAAMKTAGIDAKEGGNAIKSMVFKDIAPSGKALEEFSEATGQSLEAIIDTTKGDPIKTLQAIGEAMEGMPSADKVAVIKEVFGIHQGSKALGMINSLTEGLKDNNSQMSKAFEIANAGPAQWGATAQGELRSLREADWVKAKAAVEDVKLALSDFGAVMLAEGAPVLKQIGNGLAALSSWFRDLNPDMQKTIMWMGLTAAAAGPLIMAIGLTANGLGQMMGFMKLITRPFGSMDLMTTKQAATKLAAEQTTLAINNEARAFQNLYKAQNDLAMKTYGKVAPMDAAMVGKFNGKRDIASMAAATGVAGTTARGSGGYGNPAIVAASTYGRSMKNAEDAGANIARSSAKTKRSWDGISTKAQTIGIAAGMMGSMSTSSDNILNKISNVVFFGALIGPTILKGIQAVLPVIKGKITSLAGTAMWKSFAARGTAALAKIGVAAGAAKIAIASIGSAWAAAAGPVAALGAVAIGAYYIMNKRAREAREEQEALNNSITTTGEVLGLVTDNANDFKVGGDKNTESDYRNLAEKWMKSNDKAAKMIKNLKDSQTNEKAAIQAGIQHGQEGMMQFDWSKEEAMEAARLYAVAINNEVAVGIDKKIDIEPFVTIRKVRVQQADRVGKTLKKALEDNAVKGDKDNPFFASRTEGYNGIANVQSIMAAARLTPAGKVEVKRETKAAWDVYVNANGQARKEAFDRIKKSAYVGLEQVYSNMTKDQKKALAKVGVDNEEDLARYAEEVGPQAVVKYLEAQGAGLSPQATKNFQRSIAYMNEVMIQMLMKATGKNRKRIEAEFGKNPISFDNLMDVESFKGAGASMDSIRKATADYRKELQDLQNTGYPVTEQIRLRILNRYREEMGLKRVKHSSEGFEDAMKKETRASKENVSVKEKQARANDKLANTLTDLSKFSDDMEVRITANSKNAKEQADKYVGVYKDIMAGVQEDAFQFVTDTLEEEHESRLNAIERDGEKRINRLDAEQERKEEQFEKRQEAIDKAFEAKERKFDTRWDNTMDRFDKRWDNTLENFDEKWDRKNEKFTDRWDKTVERFERRAEDAKKAVERQYDRRIEKIEESIKVEQKAEDQRQRIFEREKARIQYLADMANRSIDINVALNTGDLDEAARLSNDAIAARDLYNVGDAGEISQSASQKKIERLEAKREALEKSKDGAIERIEKRMEAERKALEESRKIAERTLEIAQKRERKILEAQQERERKALEKQKDFQRRSLQAQRDATNKRLERERDTYNKTTEAQRKAISKQVENKRKSEDRKYELAKRALDDEMDALKAAVPRTRKELRDHMNKMQHSYNGYGTLLKRKGREWTGYVGERMVKRTRIAKNSIASDINWEGLGKSIAAKMARGGFDMSLKQFIKWIGGGAPPNAAGAGGKKNKKGKSARQFYSGSPGMTGYSTKSMISRHSGGVIDGSKGSRVGFSGKNQSQSEVTVNALRGESILNRRATRSLGPGGVDALNKGVIDPNRGIKKKGDREHQIGDGPGVAAAGGGMAFAMMRAAINRVMQQAGAEQQALEMGNWSASAPDAGRYGTSTFNRDQLKNAAAIASVGRSLGASSRDIIIALMTAMQESTLRNLSWGDRDSVGLFQQRDAWGSFKDRTNPRKAAEMFFLGGAQGQQGLFDKAGRNNMSLAEAAQAVQVSAFPSAYAKWADEARAIYNAFTWKGSNALIGNTAGVYGYKKQAAWIKKAVPGTIITSGLRTGTLGGKSSLGSYHNRGRAIDMSDPARSHRGYSRIFNTIKSAFPNATELIYSPMGGKQVLNGKNHFYGGATRANHYDHVHWAMKNGGMVPGRGRGDKTHIMGEPGEFMMRKKAVDAVGPDFLKYLNSDKFVNMPNPAVSSVGTAGNGGNIDNSRVTSYNVNVDARGNENAQDIGKAVENVLTKLQRREGFNRRIGR